MIDAHTHRYPPEVFLNPQKFAHSQGENHWLTLISPTNGNSLQGWSSREKMIADMDRASVQKAVLLGWYWENPDTCILQNDWHAEWIKEDPERFYAFATIHPSIQNPVDELKKRQEQGFVGIGEIHLGVQGFSMQDPAWIDCIKFASELGWPINFHVTEPIGHEHPGRIPTPLEDFLWLAREFPELKIILAHAGGLFPFYELNPKVRIDLKNVYYDLAACPLLYDSSIYRKLIDTVGHKKIIWGSDYPLKIFPKLQHKPDFSTFIEEILKVAELNDDEKYALFHQNIFSLLSC
ncbi:MAG: amidohydrolase family protein [Opitutales bacterium]|nr:amidohydrolase family protein [Opitutales bacterium]